MFTVTLLLAICHSNKQTCTTPNWTTQATQTTCVHTHTHTHKHTHVHVHTQTHIHIHDTPKHIHTHDTQTMSTVRKSDNFYWQNIFVLISTKIHQTKYSCCE